MEPQERISRASLHVEVADRVREMIFEGSLPPGYRIEELDLSAKLGTSRTPLREALKVLAHEGLVRLEPGRGAFVTELAPREIDTLFPVLAMLEARCAVEAVRRKTASDLVRLERIQQRMEEHCAAGDSDAYHRVSDEMHHLLHVMASNPWLLRVTGDLRRFLRLFRAAAGQPDTRLLQSLAEHRTLMKAVARGDAEGAGQVMQHHLLSQQKAWRTAMLSREREAHAGGVTDEAGATATTAMTAAKATTATTAATTTTATTAAAVRPAPAVLADDMRSAA